MMSSIIRAILGGALIGAASSLMLLTLGRVTGISGILNGVLGLEKGQMSWRSFFLLGLVCGGLILNYLAPEVLNNSLNYPDIRLVAAGLLVGFGTVLGSGCTSGHGICGLSRLSIRSLIATLTFMLLGILTAGIL